MQMIRSVRRGRALAVTAIATAALGTLAGLAIAGPVSSLAIAKRTVAGASKQIVVDNRGVTVYELGGESLAHLQCVNASCFAFWPPLKVASASAKVSLGAGVPGKVSIIHRVRGGFYQVTLDRHPLYYFSGDKGHARSAKGQGIQSFGGTWHVVPSSSTR
jgi:predicted lipoprotein with Yx(FWY)xxD motif